MHQHSREGDPPPRQLDRPSPYFTGRAAELAALASIAARPGVFAVLSGLGGVGKTELARQWAGRVAGRYLGGQLFVDLAGFSAGEPLSPDEALGRLLRALGLRPDELPATRAERAAAYRTRTAQRPYLVLLDNAHSADQVVDLLPPHPSAVVVTSRDRLAGLLPRGAWAIDVEPLDPDESVTMLANYLGPERVEPEREQAVAIARHTDGLPIALAVVAARLTERPRLSLARVAADLADETVRLGHLSTLDRWSVPAAFDFSYRWLDEVAAKVYRRVALHPAPEFGLAAVGALVPDESPAAVTDAITTLVATNLLTEVVEGRFRQHDLIRLHALAKAVVDEPAGELERRRLGLLEWYLARARSAGQALAAYDRPEPYAYRHEHGDFAEPQSRADSVAWLELERDSLFGAGRDALAAGQAELAWHLGDAVWPLLLYRKHYEARLAVDQRGVDAAVSWGHPRAEAVMRKRLGRAYALLGDLALAQRHLLAARDQFQELGDVRGVVRAEEGLATTFEEFGRDPEAIDILRRTLATNRELGDTRATGLTLLRLGRLLSGLGRPREALALLTEADGIFAGLAAADPYNHARVHIGLAWTQLAGRDLAAAGSLARQAAATMDDLGSPFERADAVEVLGRVAEVAGDLSAAGRHYREALAVFERVRPARAKDLTARLSALPAAR